MLSCNNFVVGDLYYLERRGMGGTVVMVTAPYSDSVALRDISGNEVVYSYNDLLGMSFKHVQSQRENVIHLPKENQTLTEREKFRIVKTRFLPKEQKEYLESHLFVVRCLDIYGSYCINCLSNDGKLLTINLLNIIKIKKCGKVTY